MMSDGEDVRQLRQLIAVLQDQCSRLDERMVTLQGTVTTLVATTEKLSDTATAGRTILRTLIWLGGLAATISSITAAAVNIWKLHHP